jgi:hypothetical protein
MSRTLVLSTFLAASLVLGAAPSFADMSPADAGISDSDWSMVTEIGDYNGAYMEYVDNQGEPVLVFTGGHIPNPLTYPSDFTGFAGNLTLYGEQSQFTSNSAIDSTIGDTVAQIQAAGYGASSAYNPDADVVEVTTDAPSSVTNPMVSSYGGKIHITVGTPDISASDWDLIRQVADYNGAYTVYLDAQGAPVMVFTGGGVPHTVNLPPNFPGFTDRNLQLWGQNSGFTSNSAIDSTLNDTVTRIQAAGYSASSTFNPYTDKVDVTTDAPPSVTDPLVSTYGGGLNIIAGSFQSQSDTTSTKHGSPKKHAFKKHVKGKKPGAKKHTQRKKPATKHFKKAVPARGTAHKAAITLHKTR